MSAGATDQTPGCYGARCGLAGGSEGAASGGTGGGLQQCPGDGGGGSDGAEMAGREIRTESEMQ